MRENQEFPVDFVGTFLKYNASAATFELKMYGTVTLNVPSPALVQRVSKFFTLDFMPFEGDRCPLCNEYFHTSTPYCRILVLVSVLVP